MIFAGSWVPSSSVTETERASRTTWLLVTIVPDASMMNPDPRASMARGRWGRNMPKGVSMPCCCSASGRSWVVIETTAGFTWVTRPEKSASPAAVAGGVIWVSLVVAARETALKPATPASAVPASSAAMNTPRKARRRGAFPPVREDVLSMLLILTVVAKGLRQQLPVNRTMEQRIRHRYGAEVKVTSSRLKATKSRGFSAITTKYREIKMNHTAHDRIFTRQSTTRPRVMLQQKAQQHARCH